MKLVGQRCKVKKWNLDKTEKMITEPGASPTAIKWKNLQKSTYLKIDIKLLI